MEEIKDEDIIEAVKEYETEHGAPASTTDIVYILVKKGKLGTPEIQEAVKKFEEWYGKQAEIGDTVRDIMERALSLVAERKLSSIAGGYTTAPELLGT